jgi:protein SFI1
MADLLLNTRRAKNLRLPTASSRQYVASSSIFPSSLLLPRRSALAIESDAPEKPLTSTSGHPKTSLITRPPITARRHWPDKSPSRSEYAPSVTRQASPVRSVASLMNRRSRSPVKGPSSVVSGGNEGGKLWAALKEVRQAKGS